MTDVLMYPHGPRAFASALIGHLYEIAQQRSVVLLCDPLPADYRRLVARRDLFPGLQTVIDVNALGFSLAELLGENRRWVRTIRSVLDRFEPRLVVTENDMSSLFDMYLLREARRRGIRTMSIQAMGQANNRDSCRMFDLWTRYQQDDRPGRFRQGVRALRRSVRVRLGHGLVHYVLPWMTGQAALTGPSSYVSHVGVPGMRDSELHLVQTDAQCRVFLEAGCASERLAILEHPASRIPLDAFLPEPPAEPSTSPNSPSVLVLLGVAATGFDRVNGAVIPASLRRRLRIDAVEAIRARLPEWRVLVKAHPTFGTASRVAEYLDRAAPRAEIADPSLQVEPMLRDAAVVIDLPAATTSALATAAAAFPGKPVIAADLDRDLLGTWYADWPGVSHVSSVAELESVLDAIGRGTFSEFRASRGSIPVKGIRRFRSTLEATDHLIGAGAGAAFASRCPSPWTVR